MYVVLCIPGPKNHAPQSVAAHWSSETYPRKCASIPYN